MLVKYPPNIPSLVAMVHKIIGFIRFRLPMPLPGRDFLPG